MKTLETDRNLKKKRYKILMTAFSVKKKPPPTTTTKTHQTTDLIRKFRI